MLLERMTPDRDSRSSNRILASLSLAPADTQSSSPVGSASFSITSSLLPLSPIRIYPKPALFQSESPKQPLNGLPVPVPLSTNTAESGFPKCTSKHVTPAYHPPGTRHHPWNGAYTTRLGTPGHSPPGSQGAPGSFGLHTPSPPSLTHFFLPFPLSPDELLLIIFFYYL